MGLTVVFFKPWLSSRPSCPPLLHHRVFLDEEPRPVLGVDGSGWVAAAVVVVGRRECEDQAAERDGGEGAHTGPSISTSKSSLRSVVPGINPKKPATPAARNEGHSRPTAWRARRGRRGLVTPCRVAAVPG